MKTRSLVTFLALCTEAVVAPPPDPATAAKQTHGETSPPHLIVMLVVDQMRADYLGTFEPVEKLATLLRDGAMFDRAEYPYMNTVRVLREALIRAALRDASLREQ